MDKKAPLVSVVMPCLNEEEAIGGCIEKIKKVFALAGIDGEIVVSDNGSTDNSASIAAAAGARVVHQPLRGYGNTYIKGFDDAKGRYLIMVDADQTYDFDLITEFLKKLIDEGYDFVTGTRKLDFIDNKGMVLSHNLGNRILTFILNSFFNTHYTDVYCGFRGFSRQAYERIKPVSPGMEFNLELAINAAQAGLKICEIPTMLSPRKGKSKLKPYRDGWRSLRIILLHSQSKVFLYPGLALLAIGMFIHIAFLSGLIRYKDAGSGDMIGTFATILSVMGFNMLSLGLGIKTYLWSYFETKNSILKRFYDVFKLEHGLLLGAGMFVVGSMILAILLVKWRGSGLPPFRNPEWTSFAATLVILGITTAFSSIFISIISLRKTMEAR